MIDLSRIYAGCEWENDQVKKTEKTQTNDVQRQNTKADQDSWLKNSGQFEMDESSIRFVF